MGNDHLLFHGASSVSDINPDAYLVCNNRWHYLGMEEKMSEWISVKDRLPHATKRYLIAARGDVTEAVFHTGGLRWEACNSRQTVTAEHWMELPTPPPAPDAFQEWTAIHRKGPRWWGDSLGNNVETPVEPFYGRCD